MSSSEEQPVAEEPLPDEQPATMPQSQPEGMEVPMYDVKPPHVHAPHGGVSSWREFFTHIAIVAIGLLLAIGMEQGVEYVHHQILRGELETQMRDTFEANLLRVQKNSQVLNDFRAYLIDVQHAVAGRMEGRSDLPPTPADNRNFAYAPPPGLGSYEAFKLNGSLSLLELDRIRLYVQIEFQQNLMQVNFQNFFSSLLELRAFASQFGYSVETVPAYHIPQPNIEKLSFAELVEYRALLGKVIEQTGSYGRQLGNMASSYRLVLRGVSEADALADALAPPQDNIAMRQPEQRSPR